MRENKKMILSGAVLVSVVSMASSYMIHSSSRQKARASTSLSIYLNELGVNASNYACNKDSDGDGYASCSYNNGKEIVPLECDSALIFNTNSCKKPKYMYGE